MSIDPITGITLVKTAAELSKKLYDVAKTIKDRDARERVDEVIDKLRELKQQAADLEDENRELSEKLRFKSEEFEFRTPFYYEKSHSDRPLCAKCFANQKAAPMSEPFEFGTNMCRNCLVCGNSVTIERGHCHSPLVGYEPTPFS